jgi:hypothetical protein
MRSQTGELAVLIILQQNAEIIFEATCFLSFGGIQKLLQQDGRESRFAGRLWKLQDDLAPVVTIFLSLDLMHELGQAWAAACMYYATLGCWLCNSDGLVPLPELDSMPLPPAGR